MKSDDIHNFSSQPLWGKRVSDTLPHVIAGPCSAESRSQVIETAKALKAIGVSTFRAGIWKPRTYPGHFEGQGERALPWLVEAREETGMYIGTEVGLAKHVEATLKYDIDFVWIGARTTSSPFAIQEIAKALQGTGIPILIKNPPAPSMDIWMGAIERFIEAGHTQIALIHRGFDIGLPRALRNAPLWEMTEEFRREIPQVPIYLDPSHIAGKSELIKPFLQIAIALKYDGVMVESHIHPNDALTDKAQQITPYQLSQCIDSTLQKPSGNSDTGTLQLLRDEMNGIDERLMLLLSQRRKLSQKIGEVKAEMGVTPFQEGQYQYKIGQLAQLANTYDIPVELVRSLYEAIHNDSVSIQDK